MYIIRKTTKVGKKKEIKDIGSFNNYDNAIGVITEVMENAVGNIKMLGLGKIKINNFNQEIILEVVEE